MNNPHAGHRKRLRERFLKSGLDGFQSHEILELMLFYALPRIDTNSLAHELIDRFGSISGVFDAPVDELIKVSGLTENGAVLLKMIPPLCGIYGLDSLESEVLDNSQKVCAYFWHSFMGIKNEQLRIVCLDNNLKIVASTILNHGTVSAVPMCTRSIVEFTYRSGCEMIILAHNHPGGRAEPSQADIAANTQLCGVLKSVGIKLLDHIIVGGERAMSMYDSGYFSEF